MTLSLAALLLTIMCAAMCAVYISEANAPMAAFMSACVVVNIVTAIAAFGLS